MRKLMSLSLLFLLLLIFSCKKDNTTIPAEPVKGINGSWKIVKALRNGTDLTARFNFSAFRITFADSSYTIENPVPFIVNKNGSWAFDDPTYPFKMSFKAPSDAAVSSDIQYPVTDGVRSIVISCNPGCVLNTYQYTLQKAD